MALPQFPERQPLQTKDEVFHATLEQVSEQKDSLHTLLENAEESFLAANFHHPISEKTGTVIAEADTSPVWIRKGFAERKYKITHDVTLRVDSGDKDVPAATYRIYELPHQATKGEKILFIGKKADKPSQLGWDIYGLPEEKDIDVISAALVGLLAEHGRKSLEVQTRDEQKGRIAGMLGRFASRRQAD